MFDPDVISAADTKLVLGAHEVRDSPGGRTVQRPRSDQEQAGRTITPLVAEFQTVRAATERLAGEGP